MSIFREEHRTLAKAVQTTSVYNHFPFENRNGLFYVPSHPERAKQGERQTWLIFTCTWA